MPLIAESLPSLAAETVAAKPFELTKHGIVFHRPISNDEYESLGRRVCVVVNAGPWQLGDWLVAGTGRYEDAGTTYAIVHRLTGRRFETIRAWLEVALAYPHAERGLVAWTLYRDALRLPAADRLRALTIAHRNGWTRADFAAYIETRTSGDRRAATRGRSAGEQRVLCPFCREVFAARGHYVPPDVTDEELAEANR